MKLVKITHDEDGEKVDNAKWCYAIYDGDAERALCSGQVFGEGEGEAKYKEKEVAKGGITCEDCRRIILEIKAIKL